MESEYLREKLMDGTIGALSIDTCIFEETGHKLAHGNFKHLEQFREGGFRLVFSEMTLRELSAHIQKKTEEARSALRKGLADVGSYWMVPEARRSEILFEFTAAGDYKAMANHRIKDFLERCGAESLPVDGNVDLKQLISRYFDTRAPFESGKGKKNEFPDALTMMSLESWAKTHGKAILFVTKDKGCQAYCEESEYLAAVEDLGEALSLIQERDVVRRRLADAIASLIEQGAYPGILESITIAISGNGDSVIWTPEASSYCNYDAELYDVEVLSAYFTGEGKAPLLRPVDFTDGALVLQTTMDVDVDAMCHFSFSIRDSIDHEMVNIGNATENAKARVKLDVLLSFEITDDEIPALVDIELVPALREIDFGTVAPDFSDEDPTYEKY